MERGPNLSLDQYLDQHNRVKRILESHCPFLTVMVMVSELGISADQRLMSYVLTIGQSQKDIARELIFDLCEHLDALEQRKRLI